MDLLVNRAAAILELGILLEDFSSFPTSKGKLDRTEGNTGRRFGSSESACFFEGSRFLWLLINERRMRTNFRMALLMSCLTQSGALCGGTDLWPQLLGRGSRVWSQPGIHSKSKTKLMKLHSNRLAPKQRHLVRQVALCAKLAIFKPHSQSLSPGSQSRARRNGMSPWLQLSHPEIQDRPGELGRSLKARLKSGAQRLKQERPCLKKERMDS